MPPPPLCFPWPSAVRDGATPNASTPFVDVPLTVGRAVLFDHRVHHCLLPAMARRHILRFEVGGSAPQQCAIHRVCSGLCLGVCVPVCTCVYMCVHVHRHHRRAGVARARVNRVAGSRTASTPHPSPITRVSQIMYSAQGRWRDRAVSAEVPEVPHVAVGPPTVKASAKPCDAVTVTSAGAGAGRGLRFGGVVGGWMCGVGDAVYFHFEPA